MKRAMFFLLALALLQCRGGASSLAIVTSVYPFEFIAKHLAPSKVKVVELTKPGAEPHDLELTPGQVRQVEQAELVLYLDSGFQPAVSKAAKNNENAINVLELPEIKSDLIRNGAIDPHIWLDPVLMSKVAGLTSKEIARKTNWSDSGSQGRLEKLGMSLDDLHTTYSNALKNCERKEIVTSHAAFAYLARRYGLTQISITGVDPEAEPSPARLAEVADLARKAKTTTIFSERLVSSKIAESLANEIGATVAVLDPIEGPPPSGDYLGAMESNLEALKKGLGCR
jgi:zinc transport system substrate-binding protein